ncbi:type II secretion system F family protein [Alicyclobacillus tolerans]|uniref:type II secretion system F family protein n=1 Tax=Alicyclobacillus tolerans TaxID=90970 RepID=UPI001F15BA31|nr:type II secretion system F family protein [Alicyclobacillus tolerans]MCF8567437.1 type II secretion system F family protein [Alicyclobacillus tolerans]
MNSAWYVSALILSAGALWSISRKLEQVWVRKQTQRAFEGMRRMGSQVKTPLARFHPMYDDWLRQMGSRRTAKRLEFQQWGLAILTLAVFYNLSRNILVSLVFGAFAFVFPVLQVRAGMRRIAAEVSREMRKFILLLRIYVKSGLSNLKAVQRVEPHLQGKLQQVVKDTYALMGHLTFQEAMQILAATSPSEELELVAKALKQGAKHGSEVSENLGQALAELNHRDQLKLSELRERQKQAIHMKFMLFFVTPLVIDVGLYVWGMLGAVSHSL